MFPSLSSASQEGPIAESPTGLGSKVPSREKQAVVGKCRPQAGLPDHSLPFGGQSRFDSVWIKMAAPHGPITQIGQ